MKKNITIVMITATSLLVTSAYSQVSNNTNISGTSGPLTEYAGWDGTGLFPQNLDIANQFAPGGGINYNINFWTNNPATQKMTILGTTGSDDGYVGIGTATPNRLLQVNDAVNGGVINLTGPVTAPDGSSYQINGDPVLWHNGKTSSIYVGVGAGNATSFLIAPNDNTYVGYFAGHAMHSASDNVFVGFDAGRNIHDGSGNVFIGSLAGASATGAQTSVFIGWGAGTNETNATDNTFVGYMTGSNNVGGEHNSFFGDDAGDANSTGYFNTFIGAHCSLHNTIGYLNTSLGFLAGDGNNDGYDNLFLGARSNAASASLINASAIGSHAVVTTNHTMILGDDTVRVGIGMSGHPFPGPLAKLHVQRDLAFPGLAVDDPIGIKVENNDEDKDGQFTGNGYGIHAATFGQNLTNYGGFFKTEKATENISGHFESLGAIGGSNNNINNGVNIDAENADRNYGIRTYIDRGKTNIGSFMHVYNASSLNAGDLIFANAGTTTVNNYGVSANAMPAPATIFNAAIYGNAPGLPLGSPPPPIWSGSFAGYFNGDVGHTGNLWFISDSTIKTAIEPLQNADSILNLINTYSYYFDSTLLQGSANVPRTKQFGFLAQQIERVAPNLVYNTIIPAVLDSVGNEIIPARPVKMLNPLGILPLLVQANKSLSSKDSVLEERVTALEQIVNTCCNGGHRTGSSSPGEGGNEQGGQHSTGSNDFPIKQTIDLASSGPILFQNQPNPFTGETLIRYFIPENAINPKIIFEDETGRIINETIITEKGQNSIKINSESLNAGVYAYSLQINGKVVDSKRMIRTK